MFTSLIPISGMGIEDAGSYIWLLWHTARAFLGQNQFFFTNLMFYPKGASLTFDAPLLNTFLSLPFYLWKGPLAAYNFLVIFSFIGTFLGFYLFLKTLTGSRPAAIISSLIFTFSAYRLNVLAFGQADLLSTEWIGFSFYFLFKYFKEGKLWKNITGFTFFLSLSAYSDYRTFLISIILAVFTVIFFSLLNQKEFKKVCSIIGPSMVLLTVFLLPLIILHRNNLFASPTFFEQDSPRLVTADLLSYFFPFKSLSKFYFNLTFPFVGFSSIALFIYYIFFAKKESKDKKLIYLFTLLAITFLTLSLGNGVNIFGTRVWTSDFMPYPLLNKLSAFSFFRSPVRFSLGVHVAIAAISAVILKNIFQKIESRKIKNILFTAFVGIAILQNMPFVPKIYLYNLAPDPVFKSLGSMPYGTVLNVPFGYLDSFHSLHGIYDTRLTLAQIDHKKPVMNGYLSYIDEETINKLENDSFINKVTNCETKNECRPLTSKESLAAIAKFNITYILVDKTYDVSKVKAFLQKSFKTSVISESQEFILLSVVRN